MSFTYRAFLVKLSLPLVLISCGLEKRLPQLPPSPKSTAPLPKPIAKVAFEKNSAEEDAVLLDEVLEGSKLLILQDLALPRNEALYLFVPGVGDPSERVWTSEPENYKEYKSRLKNLRAHGDGSTVSVHTGELAASPLEVGGHVSLKAGAEIDISSHSLEDRGWYLENKGNALLQNLGLKEFSLKFLFERFNMDSSEYESTPTAITTVGEFNAIAGENLYLKPARIPEHLDDAESYLALLKGSKIRIKMKIDSTLVTEWTGDQEGGYLLLESLDENLKDCTWRFKKDLETAIEIDQELSLSERAWTFEGSIYLQFEDEFSKSLVCEMNMEDSAYRIGDIRASVGAFFEVP